MRTKGPLVKLRSISFKQLKHETPCSDVNNTIQFHVIVCNTELILSSPSFLIFSRRCCEHGNDYLPQAPTKPLLYARLVATTQAEGFKAAVQIATSQRDYAVLHQQCCQPLSLVNKLLPLIFWHKKLTVLVLTGQGLVSVLRVLLERLAKTPGYAALSRACGIPRYKDVDDAACLW